MPEGLWMLAQLTPEQERALKDAEADLQMGVLLAFAQAPVRAADLTADELGRLQDVERRLGLVIIAVQPALPEQRPEAGRHAVASPRTQTQRQQPVRARG